MLSATLVGIIGSLVGHAIHTYLSQPVIYEVEASEPVATEVPVLIRVEVDWTRERIEEEIRSTFPETPNTAVAIAICESGLVKDIQSHHILNGSREKSFGIFQIYSPVWHNKAIALGYENYRTDPAHNIKMARYIYDNAGQTWKDWSCYTKGMYKAKL